MRVLERSEEVTPPDAADRSYLGFGVDREPEHREPFDDCPFPAPKRFFSSPKPEPSICSIGCYRRPTAFRWRIGPPSADPTGRSRQSGWLHTPDETEKFRAERATRAIRRSRGDQYPVIHPMGDEHTTRNPRP